ncbi:MAG: hypothetical protein QM778_33745 [Myxococcales bacterium]
MQTRRHRHFWILALALFAASPVYAQEDPDADGDGVPDENESPGDTDGDGKLDVNDSDDDGDGIPTAEELVSGNADGDEWPDFRDPDDDNDHVLTKNELGIGGWQTPLNTDGIGAPDYLDDDDDDDGAPTAEEVWDAEWDPDRQIYDPLTQDTDKDGIKDFRDADDDGDTIPSELETEYFVSGTAYPIPDTDNYPGDQDNDNQLNAVDRDDDNDGILTKDELGPNGYTNPRNTDGTGLPDYLDDDDDDDGESTAVELSTNPEPDFNGNGIPDYLDPEAKGSQADPPPLLVPGADADDDGVSNELEDLNRDGRYWNDNTDGDKLADYVDDDDDNDGIKTIYEKGDPANPPDSDGDKIPDYLDPDDDGDGVLTKDEHPDANGDGDPSDYLSTASAEPNYLNPDDDDDGKSTFDERPGGLDVDSDHDGIPDYLDEDDLPSSGGPTDGDLDTDGDGIPDKMEMPGGVAVDTDGDGIPDYLDPDDDGDGIPTKDEGKGGGVDTDGDGIPDYLDPDADGDGIPDKMEGTGDSDGDGVPDYLDDNGAGMADAGTSGGGSDAGGGGSGNPPLGEKPQTKKSDSCSVSAPASATFPALSMWSLVLAGVVFAARRRRARSALAMVAGALLMQACGDDTEPPSEGLLGGDGGHHEPGHDAGSQPADSGMPESDAATDAGPTSSVTPECTIEDGSFQVELPAVEGSPWASTLQGDTLHLAYLGRSCGTAENVTGTGVRYQTFRVAGGTVADIDNMDGDFCLTTLHPAVSADSGGATVFYSSNLENGMELYSHSAKPTTGRNRLTFDADSGGDQEVLTVAETFGDAALLAYANRQGKQGPFQIVTARPSNFSENEIAPASLDYRPTQLALLGLKNAGALAWVSSGDTQGSIVLQPLAANGKASGASVVLSDQVGSYSGVSFGALPDQSAAAVVYSVALAGNTHELRFRELGADGAPTADEVKLTSGNRDASGVSLAPFAAGYVAAFRWRRADGPPVIRLMFINKRGGIGGERTLSEAALTGEDTRVHALPDGRLLVLWSDSTGTGSTLHVVRANCI